MIIVNAKKTIDKTVEEGVKKFKEWFKDLPLVAHNAAFDMGFVKAACARNEDVGSRDFTYIDDIVTGISNVMKNVTTSKYNVDTM